jgi:type IV pilus assembly protein PilM
MNRVRSRFLGIEITDMHVKWLEAVPGNTGKPFVHTMDAEPLPAGAVDEGRILQPTAVIQALKTLMERSASRTKQVHLVLPSTLSMVRFLKLPDVKMKDLKKVIDFELKYNIPLPFSNPYYDFIKLPADLQKQPRQDDAATESSWNHAAPKLQWETPEQEAAASSEDAAPVKQCEVMLVAAPLQTIEEYADLLATAGLKPVSIEIKALSLFRTVERLKPIDPMSTFVTVDVTATYADVSIYQGGALRITRNKQVRFPSAASTDSEADTWAQFEFQTACQDLSSEIERFINFYRYSLHHREFEVDHLLVSGDIEDLSGVISYLSNRLSFDVRPLQLDAIEVEPGQTASFPLLRFAAPLGLALRGTLGR